MGIKDNCQYKSYFQGPFEGSSEFYSFKVSPQKGQTVIDIKVTPSIDSTGDLPATIPILKRKLPGIFLSRCINDENLTFEKEAVNTEIGHLFEHILLEYLFRLKKAQGQKKVCIKGYTDWDYDGWGRGVYKITINCGIDELPTLRFALKKSSRLLDLVFRYSLSDTNVPTSLPLNFI